MRLWGLPYFFPFLYIIFTYCFFRCWVLLDHKYNIYLYREGVLRTASDPYNPNNLQDITSHLTNHCLQEELSQNYGKYEPGNEMFYEEFDLFLQRKYNISFSDKILPQIHFIIVHCLMAIKEELSTKGVPYQSFQLFGFDFIVDSMLKVLLMEINGAPACAQ